MPFLTVLKPFANSLTHTHKRFQLPGVGTLNDLLYRLRRSQADEKSWFVRPDPVIPQALGITAQKVPLPGQVKVKTNESGGLLW